MSEDAFFLWSVRVRSDQERTPADGVERVAAANALTKRAPASFVRVERRHDADPCLAGQDSQRHKRPTYVLGGVRVDLRIKVVDQLVAENKIGTEGRDELAQFRQAAWEGERRSAVALDRADHVEVGPSDVQAWCPDAVEVVLVADDQHACRDAAQVAVELATRELRDDPSDQRALPAPPLPPEQVAQSADEPVSPHKLCGPSVRESRPQELEFGDSDSVLRFGSLRRVGLSELDQLRLEVVCGAALRLEPVSQIESVIPTRVEVDGFDGESVSDEAPGDSRCKATSCRVAVSDDDRSLDASVPECQRVGGLPNRRRWRGDREKAARVSRDGVGWALEKEHEATRQVDGRPEEMSRPAFRRDQLGSVCRRVRRIALDTQEVPVAISDWDRNASLVVDAKPQCDHGQRRPSAIIPEALSKLGAEERLCPFAQLLFSRERRWGNRRRRRLEHWDGGSAAVDGACPEANSKAAQRDPGGAADILEGAAGVTVHQEPRPTIAAEFHSAREAGLVVIVSGAKRAELLSAALRLQVRLAELLIKFRSELRRGCLRIGGARGVVLRWIERAHSPLSSMTVRGQRSPGVTPSRRRTGLFAPRRREPSGDTSCIHTRDVRWSRFRASLSRATRCRQTSSP